MMIDTTYSLYALLIANACLAAAAALAILRLQRMMRDSKSFWESPTGAAMQTATPAPTEQDRLLAHEIAVLHRTVASLCNKERPRLEVSAEKLPLEHAVRMARHGASIDDLTKKCGLNMGEARLMQRLHGKRADAATVAAVA